MPLEIVVHDVGHGQAIHAFTPNNQVIVIDLGGSSEFSPLFWLKGRTSTIDMLVVSHPHGDHIDEIELLDRHGFSIKQFWRPRWLKEDDVRNANQRSYSDALGVYFNMDDVFTAAVPDGTLVGDPDVSGGVKIQTFASSDCGVSNINNHSGVVVFSYLGVKVVISGDNEPASWKSLLEDANFVEAIRGAHVFLASHHGRESGYHSELFENMNPKLCIVSDGKVQNTDARSRYTNHASGWNVRSRSTQEITERKCLTTRSDGTVVIEIGIDRLARPQLGVTIN